MGIAIPVIFNEKLERLVLEALGKEESRSLGYELNRDKDVERERDLEDVGYPLKVSKFFGSKLTQPHELVMKLVPKTTQLAMIEPKI